MSSTMAHVQHFLRPLSPREEVFESFLKHMRLVERRNPKLKKALQDAKSWIGQLAGDLIRVPKLRARPPAAGIEGVPGVLVRTVAAAYLMTVQVLSTKHSREALERFLQTESRIDKKIHSTLYMLESDFGRTLVATVERRTRSDRQFAAQVDEGVAQLRRIVKRFRRTSKQRVPKRKPVTPPDYDKGGGTSEGPHNICQGPADDLSCYVVAAIVVVAICAKYFW
jgi:hypothetical protein